MGPFSGLGIQVISAGKTLKLYSDPDDEPANEPRTRQRYIEAVTGATFKVKISLHKNFKLSNLKRSDAVRAVIYYDNDNGWQHPFVVDDICSAWSKGRPAEYTFQFITKFDDASQQWKEGETIFSPLDIVDTASGKATVDQIERIGEIRVEVDRMYRGKHARPRTFPTTLAKPIKEIPEKLLKGKAIVNNVGTTNEVITDAPSYPKYDYSTMPGADGQKLTTVIFYRPRSTLQTLGCIPRSPSPDLEPSPPRAAGREQKIQDLRAQLALLEGDAKCKTEGSNANRRIKREAQDAEGLEITEARSANKRVRRSGPIETVDLTDD